MNTPISKAALYDHFKITTEDVSSSMYKDVFDGMAESFTAKQLCEAIVKDFWRKEHIIDPTKQKPDDHFTKSSTFSVACEKLKLFKTNQARQYAQTRGGIVFQKIIFDENGRCVGTEIISFRNIIGWMTVR